MQVPSTHVTEVVTCRHLCIGTNSHLFSIEEPVERDMDGSLSITPGMQKQP